MRKLIQAIIAIEAHLNEIAGCLVYLCHLAEKDAQEKENQQQASDER